MPIVNTNKAGPTKEHVSSGIIYEPLSRELNARFRKCLDIPEAIPSDGIVFDTTTKYLHDVLGRGKLGSLVIQQTGRELHKMEHLENPIEINLPNDTYLPGTLVLTSDSNAFQAELRFGENPNNVIRYSTGLEEGKNLGTILSLVSVLSAIPLEELDGGRKGKTSCGGESANSAA
ncbi:hypothetical protein ACFL25_00160 [Patescibacteria group bacterium]